MRNYKLAINVALLITPIKQEIIYESDNMEERLKIYIQRD